MVEQSAAKWMRGFGGESLAGGQNQMGVFARGVKDQLFRKFRMDDHRVMGG